MTLTALPYNRALDPADYLHHDLTAHVAHVNLFEQSLHAQGVPYRKDHAHCTWAYANIVRQLADLSVSSARILDVEYGGHLLTPLLRSIGFVVEATDAQRYGDCTPWLVQQCQAIGKEIPVSLCSPGAVTSHADESFDVTICLHIRDDDNVFEELCRVTKIGGYVMVGCDYFASLAAWVRSPYAALQSPMTPSEVSELLMLNPTMIEIGGTDLTYRGSHVHDQYSLVNLCLQRRT